MYLAPRLGSDQVDGETVESPTRDVARDIFGGDSGQSLVEVALASPLLLLILRGLADPGRGAGVLPGRFHDGRGRSAVAAPTTIPVECRCDCPWPAVIGQFFGGSRSSWASSTVDTVR
jgi:hypothetical protein